jgi:5,10-methylene-tetrahydrofolate dehydrogenase/methenyl tetrahydrofolate cyclohydrolase
MWHCLAVGGCRELVKMLNNDERCVGIICQLPLTDELKPYQKEICNAITPLKDMD